MMRNAKKALLLISGLALAFIFQSNSVFASEVTGSLCTGLNCPVEGTVIAVPAASPAAGSYTSTQSVTLTATGATSIRYTTDGTTPVCSASSSLYSSAISITSTKTVKAISCYPNSNTSSVSSSVYTLACATASVSNGTVSAYPTCAISCNSGYTLSGSSCVTASSGGGGGGGGTGEAVPLISTSGISPSSGGTVTLLNADGSKAQLIAPANAVTADTVVSITTITSGSSYTPPAASTGLVMVGSRIYQITAVSGSTDVTTFNQSITLKFYYSDSQVPSGVSESNLQVHYFNTTSNSWVAITSTVDTVNNTVTASVNHLTKFAVLGVKTTTVTTGMTVVQLQAEIARILALIAQLQQQLAQISGTAPTVITGVPTTFTFQTALKLNMVSEDVRYLQIVLNSDPNTGLASSGVGSSGKETNIFGPLTKAAVIKFQEKYASETLTPWGLSSGTGLVGSTTRTKLNALLGK